ncbi:MAG: hypothetical protein HOO67_00320 [Candidatus Peribacteraceae bacterium]|nr:hypothetical protein [Candidatus Peribacteraceae bacterium]
MRSSPGSQWKVHAVLSLVITASLITGAAGMQAMLIGQAGPFRGRVVTRLAQAAPVETFALPVSKTVFAVKKFPQDCEALLDLEDQFLDAAERLYNFADMLENKLSNANSAAQRVSIEKQLDETDVLIDRGWEVLDTIDGKIEAVCYAEEDQ